MERYTLSDRVKGVSKRKRMSTSHSVSVLQVSSISRRLEVYIHVGYETKVHGLVGVTFIPANEGYFIQWESRLRMILLQTRSANTTSLP